MLRARPPAGERTAEDRLSGRSIARAASWSWSGNVVSQIAWFGSLIILAALLPPRDFGAVAIGVVIAQAAMLVQDAGSRGAIVVASDLQRSQITRTVAITVVAGIGLTVLLGALARPITDALAPGGDANVVRILLASVAIRAAAIAPTAVLQRTMQFKVLSTVTAASLFIAGFVSVVAAFLGAGVWSLVIRQLVAATLLPLFAWIAAITPLRSELAAGPRGPRDERRSGAMWFFLLAVTDFVGLSIDTFVIGHLRGARQLGLYSLAFTLAFAPLTSFAWQIGKVIFPAAAASPDLETVARRMLRALRLAAGLLLPLLPPALVLSPVLLPGILGPEWKPMIGPFQILLIVGIGQALTIMIGDSLSGTGHIAFRACVHLVWCVGVALALIALVSRYGIRGAAIAHLVLFLPFALAYLVWGSRLLGSSMAAVLSALRGVALAVAAQMVVTVGCVAFLQHLGASDLAAASAAAAFDLLVVAALLARLEPALLRDFRELVRAVAPQTA
jgi:O-antigen/teichoic acid export membrane protein